MTGSIADPRLEAGIERLLMSHPSWFKRLSTSRGRSPEHPDHADVRYAAQTIVEAVLRAIDAADEASGVRRVTAQELEDKLELARAEERQRIEGVLQAEIDRYGSGTAEGSAGWAVFACKNGVRDSLGLVRNCRPISAADSPVGGVS